MIDRKFINGDIYHIFNKSIANFEIFKIRKNSYRFLQILDYYNDIFPKISLSQYLILNKNYYFYDLLTPKENTVVKFLAYCIMPDHYHLLVKINSEQQIYHYQNNIGNSYTRFFDVKYKRKGPLWQSAYKMVRIKNNEKLLHVSRYIHLNPTTAELVQKPENWEFSSYKAFITDKRILDEYIKEISISNPVAYKRFVENNKDHQRKLKLIKKLTFE